jgi:hypothetical protein
MRSRRGTGSTPVGNTGFLNAEVVRQSVQFTHSCQPGAR